MEELCHRPVLEQWEGVSVLLTHTQLRKVPHPAILKH